MKEDEKVEKGGGQIGGNCKGETFILPFFRLFYSILPIL